MSLNNFKTNTLAPCFKLQLYAYNISYNASGKQILDIYTKSALLQSV